MLNFARDLLFKEYEKNKDKVPVGSIFEIFCDEKIKHSLQVLGAANYIIKHEPYFFEQSSTFIENAQTAVLLHDIARFDEAVYRYNHPNESYEHGVKGAEFLTSFSEFNKPYIILPVRYHSDIYLTRLYEDTEFVKLSSVEQTEVEKIAQLVRDADKIANLHFFFYFQEHLRELVLSEFFSSKMAEKTQDIHPQILNEFLQNRLLASKDLSNQAERLLQIFAWVFDLNYKSSFVFCHKRKVFQQMFDVFYEICTSSETQRIVISKIRTFIADKYHIYI